jgi:hypothetical protein
LGRYIFTKFISANLVRYWCQIIWNTKILDFHCNLHFDNSCSSSFSVHFSCSRTCSRIFKNESSLMMIACFKLTDPNISE